MRSKGLYANAVYVFIQNSPFDKTPYYGGGHMVALPGTTDSTMQIANAVLGLLKKIYRPGIYYQKAGVMLMDLVDTCGQQTDLFGYTTETGRASRLMSTMDKTNEKYSKGAIRLASEGTIKAWAMRRAFKSPNYTGSWNELPKVQ